MSQNKLKLEITRDTSNGWYKVEMLDMYNNYCCVYEPSISMSMNYVMITLRITWNGRYIVY